VFVALIFFSRSPAGNIRKFHGFPRDNVRGRCRSLTCLLHCWGVKLSLFPCILRWLETVWIC